MFIEVLIAGPGGRGVSTPTHAGIAYPRPIPSFAENQTRLSERKSLILLHFHIDALDVWLCRGCGGSHSQLERNIDPNV